MTQEALNFVDHDLESPYTERDIEDALVDIQAAKAGGIWVLAAANTHSEHFLTDTDDVHTSPTTVTVETLQTLIHG